MTATEVIDRAVPYDVLYRRQDDRGQVMPILTSRKLCEGITVEVIVPRHQGGVNTRYRQETVWYCHGAGCPVRLVTVVAKYPYGDGPAKPPALRCPSCGGPLECHGYRDSVWLERVPAPPTGEHAETLKQPACS
jgi:hypothetical protein